jgi:hypothetical protein
LVYLRVKNPANGTVLLLLYKACQNKLFLVDEDGQTLLGGFAPGSANTISNRLGTLDCAGTTVTRAGDTLTVNWRVAGNAPLAGETLVQQISRDRSKVWSGTTACGTWVLTA